MVYEKQTWISYDDNKTEEQNIKDGAVVTAERMNHIEDGVEAQATKIEFEAHLDDKKNPHEVTAHQVGALTAEESSANVISQVIGKEKVELTFTTDFDSKISGSVIENPNIARHNAIATLPSPENFGGSELSDLYYELVRKKDTRNFVTTQNVATRMSANLYSFSILECLKRELGDQFFSSLGAKTDKQCVEIIRKIVSYRLVSLWASGKSFEGNKVNMRMWSILTNSWLESSNSTSSEVKLITMSGLENTNNHYITDDGKIHILAYAEASDGNVASTINTDYVSLTFKINISVHDFIESTIAAYSGENIDKKFVGLGNVDNFATATRLDAEQGFAANAFMTPFRVKQQIDYRMATQDDANNGVSTEKIISPKTLAALLSIKMPLKMYWGSGATLRDSDLNDRLPFGDLIGTDPFHVSKDIPFTLNSDKLEATMTRDANLFFDINLRLQGGGSNTAYSDYYYIQLEYGSQTGGAGENKSEFAMIGANSGQRLNLSNTLTGKAAISLKRGQKFAISVAGLRSGQKIFSWQFLSGTIEEYI